MTYANQTSYMKDWETNTLWHTSVTHTQFRFLLPILGSTTVCHTPNILSEDASWAHPTRIIWDVTLINTCRNSLLKEIAFTLYKSFHNLYFLLLILIASTQRPLLPHHSVLPPLLLRLHSLPAVSGLSMLPSSVFRPSLSTEHSQCHTHVKLKNVLTWHWKLSI
jgi:hypothetical protein